MRIPGLTSHETLARMHRKQAQGRRSHENRDPGVSRAMIMKPYRVLHGQNASTGSRVSRVMRPPGLTSHETLAQKASTGSNVSRVMKPYRASHAQKASTGQGPHESREPGVSRVMRPYIGSRMDRKHGVKGFTSYENPGSHQS